MGATELHLGTRGGALPRVQAAALALDESHLVAWSRSAPVAERFALDLANLLGHYPETQVCSIAGWLVRDLHSFCHQLEIGLAKAASADSLPRIRRDVHGPGGVVEHLKQRGGHGEDAHHVADKRRYYVWRDADALLRKDEGLFSELVDAISGVAAADEFCGPDLLFLHRAVYVGGPALNTYANKRTGQFRKWLRDRGPAGEKNEPLWRTITGVSKPPVKVMEL